MSRVAVLGERDAVLGFKASGAVAFAADDVDEARQRLGQVLEEDFAVLFVTEAMAEMLKEELQPLYERPKPVVTILPDARRPKGIGMELLKKRVERAVGANILLKGEE